MLYSNAIQICSTGTKLRLARIKEGASAQKNSSDYKRGIGRGLG